MERATWRTALIMLTCGGTLSRALFGIRTASSCLNALSVQRLRYAWYSPANTRLFSKKFEMPATAGRPKACAAMSDLAGRQGFRDLPFRPLTSVCRLWLTHSDSDSYDETGFSSAFGDLYPFAASSSAMTLTMTLVLNLSALALTPIEDCLACRTCFPKERNKKNADRTKGE